MTISFSRVKGQAVTFLSGPPLSVVCPACGHEKAIEVTGLHLVAGEPFNYNAECPACTKPWTEQLVLNVTLTPNGTDEVLAAKLAQAALRGWFGDPDGFKNMSEPGNHKAVKAILQVLAEPIDNRGQGVNS